MCIKWIIQGTLLFYIVTKTRTLYKNYEKGRVCEAIYLNHLFQIYIANFRK